MVCYVKSDGGIFRIPLFCAMSCSSPIWDNLPSGNQRYLLKGLNLGHMYWGQKQSSE